MKFIIFATLFAAAAAQYYNPQVIRVEPAYAAPVVRVAIPIVKYVMNNDNYGSYSLDTLSGDGSTFVETGALKNLGDKEGPVNVKSGSYSFLTPEGQTVHTSYTADEFGFRVAGSHLPVAPAVPALPVELVDAFRKAGSTLF